MIGGAASGRDIDPGDLAAARHLLERMNLTPADLAGDVVGPTFAELVPEVVKAMPAGSRRTYRGYLDRLVAEWGPCRLHEFDAGDVTRFLEGVRESALVRRSSIGGGGAALHAYHALTWLYRYAVEHGLIGVRQNVVNRVSIPARGEPRRFALSPQLIADITAVARNTGRDPALDALLLRFHLETAARTGGALALRLRDLDPDQSLVRLREKNSTQRWQPVSPTLMEHLLHHARERGVRDGDEMVLRYANGSRLGRARYETLWLRVGQYVESVRLLGVSTHWLRHTTVGVDPF